ncbi:hypothetical protein DFP73DRAFT_633880 [Morchella snyderi]|nr:hypothetical protein DFP73DRAFT_633880 [Morchella snyderi]
MKQKIKNKIAAIYERSGLSRIHLTFEPIRQKLFSSTDRISALLELCYSLARISPGWSSGSGFLQEKHFQQSPLKLKIKTLGNKVVKLVLPASTQKSPEPYVREGSQQGDGCNFSSFISMLPESCRAISRKASPLGLVSMLFPYGKTEENMRYVACCFWIWLCIVDDLTEHLVGEEWEQTEHDIMVIFNTPRDSMDCLSYFNKDSDAVKVSHALRTVIDATSIYYQSGVVSAPWKVAFNNAVKEVIAGFRAERPLLSADRIELSDWMPVRMVTISVRPFMILAKASLNLDLTMSNFGNPLREDQTPASNHRRGYDATLAKVERLLQLIMGLQNDILGWEKDFTLSNPLNAIQILILHGATPTTAFADVVETHNELVRQLFHYGERAWIESLTAGDDTGVPGGATVRTNCSSFMTPAPAPRQRLMPDEDVQSYLELIMGFANGMACWMAVSRRYAVSV